MNVYWSGARRRRLATIADESAVQKLKTRRHEIETRRLHLITVLLCKDNEIDETLPFKPVVLMAILDDPFPSGVRSSYPSPRTDIVSKSRPVIKRD